MKITPETFRISHDDVWGMVAGKEPETVYHLNFNGQKIPIMVDRTIPPNTVVFRYVDWWGRLCEYRMGIDVAGGESDLPKP